MSAPRMTSKLEALLVPHEEQLTRLHARWYALEIFLGELRTVTQGRPFEVHDRAAWHWMIDAQEMLEARMQSWVRAITGEGGFFAKVAAKPEILAELRAQFPDDEYHDPGERTRRMLTVQERFGAMEHVMSGQLDELASVIEHRIAHTSIALTDEAPPGQDPAAPSLFLNEELDYQLHDAERICRDIRLSAGLTPRPLFDLPPRRRTSSARALVDAILLGAPEQIDKIDRPEIIQGTPAREDRRQRAYDALLAATPNPKEPFNTEADLARVLGLYEDEDEL